MVYGLERGASRGAPEAALVHTLHIRLELLARIALALPLIVFGLDGLLGLLPPDVYPEHGPQAAEFLRVIQDSGYLWEVLKIVEVAVGVALLAGRFVPLALVAIAPVIVNIVGFHLTMEREGTWLAFWLVALAGYLAWVHRASLRPLLAPRPAQPG